jgi:hypothetical protein
MSGPAAFSREQRNKYTDFLPTSEDIAETTKQTDRHNDEHE